MGVENFLNYEHYIELQNKQLQIWGQNCTIFIPQNITNLGYENTTNKEIASMDSDGVLANKYVKQVGKIWINFKIEKKVFYKFNYFPEDGEDLVMAFMDSSCNVRENSYIRTCIPGTVSIWGDLIFEVVHIQDIGLAQVLQRAYFLKATNNRELYSVLGVSSGIDTPSYSQGTETIKSSSITYNDLSNKPKINGVTLIDDKTSKELGIDDEKYTDTSGSGITIGGIKEGETFKDQAVADVFYQMLHPNLPPTLTVTTIPESGLYPVDKEITSIKFIVGYKRGTEALVNCKIEMNGIVFYTKTIQDDEGSFTVDYKLDYPVGEGDIIDVVLSDSKNSVSKQITYQFSEYSYIGSLGDVLPINASSIKSLDKVCVGSSDYTSENLTSEYGRVIYAYPSTFPELKSISDYATGFNLTNSFESTYIDIDGINYRVYYLKDSSGFNNVKIVFKS